MQKFWRETAIRLKAILPQKNSHPPTRPLPCHQLESRVEGAAVDNGMLTDSDLLDCPRNGSAGSSPTPSGSSGATRTPVKWRSFVRR